MHIIETEPSEVFYADAVRKGIDAIAGMASKQWILGDLALEVEKVYGEQRLERYAEDINFPGAPCTLARYRSVCAAFPKTGGRPLFFGSAQKLQKHPDRLEIVERNPAISKAEAIKLMSEWRAEHPGTDDEQDDEKEDPNNEQKEDPNNEGKGKGKGKGKPKPNDEKARLKEVKRVFGKVVSIANDAVDAAINVRHEDPDDLLKVVEERLVDEVRKAGEELIGLADELYQLFDEATEKLKQEGHLLIAPKPAPEQQPEVGD
jgi:hypothetical protein